MPHKTSITVMASGSAEAKQKVNELQKLSALSVDNLKFLAGLNMEKADRKLGDSFIRTMVKGQMG